MTDSGERQHRQILKKIAQRVMIERGLIPEYPIQVLNQLKGIQEPANGIQESVNDLRNLIWCSIDNDDSLDLDQLTVAEVNPDGSAKLLIAIADVDAIVKKQSAIDDYARQNTTSVYTVAEDICDASGKTFNGSYFSQL